MCICVCPRLGWLRKSGETELGLTVLSLQLGPLAGEVIDRTLGLLGFAPVLIHLVFQGPAHLLQISLKEKGESYNGCRGCRKVCMVQLKEKEEGRHRKEERIRELGRRRKVGHNHQRREGDMGRMWRWEEEIGGGERLSTGPPWP